MFPVLELAGTHKEVAAVNATQPHIIAAHPKLAFLKAHGRGAIAAAATLVKHERAVLLAQQVDGGFGGLGSEDAGGRHGARIGREVLNVSVIASNAKQSHQNDSAGNRS